jgi:hypothetical protein
MSRLPAVCGRTLGRRFGRCGTAQTRRGRLSADSNFDDRRSRPRSAVRCQGTPGQRLRARRAANGPPRVPTRPVRPHSSRGRACGAPRRGTRGLVRPGAGKVDATGLPGASTRRPPALRMLTLHGARPPSSPFLGQGRERRRQGEPRGHRLPRRAPGRVDRVVARRRRVQNVRIVPVCRGTHGRGAGRGTLSGTACVSGPEGGR